MRTLENAKSAKKNINRLMVLNQNTFIRDKDGTPTGTSWTLENQMEMFRLTIVLRDSLDSIEHKLSLL